MKLILPFPPSFNGYWRNLNNRTVISKPGRQFRTNAIVAVYEQLKCKPKAITHHVSIAVVLYPPNNIKRDLDNYLKAGLDALTHARVWVDDSQVKKIDIEWGEVVKDGKMEIAIEPYKCKLDANAVA